MNRREFALGMLAATKPADLVAGVETTTLIRYEDYGKCWFSARACVIPGRRRKLLMTLGQITGSDVFHHVHWMESDDEGRTWSAPQPVPGMGRVQHEGGLEEGFGDTTPEYHARTGTVLGIAQNVYYRNNVLTMPWEKRWPLYTVRTAQGAWSPLRKLEWDDPDATGMYASNCSQRVTLDDGSLIVPVTYGPLGRPDHGVCSLHCSFDGARLAVIQRGNELRLPVKRGLLEPSVTRREKGRFWMTIRAEDNRGYVTTSRDGLKWAPIQPWCWQDGTPLEMSTTQQHWLPHSDALYLAYTRKAPGNERVMRWRTPLFMARVDEQSGRLMRETERVVLPQRGDGGDKGMDAWLSGNFHATVLNEHESIITDGQINPARGYIGDVLMARIRWKRPNRLAL
ncbi:MAG: exo-alpha-sialidase [Bryobacterales bacterium]|nr:exo-alpha-sialidase [Bryobacterales bacterium]